MPVRVLISGAIAHHPIGGAGNAWAFLQYALGFRALGVDVCYVEHLPADGCIDDQWQRAPFATSANAGFFAAVMGRFGLTGQAALLQRDGPGCIGLPRKAVLERAAEADLFINMSGRFHDWEILRAARRRLYLDLDPGFTQVWQGKYGSDMNMDGHDVFATVGLNIGRSVCPFPTLGIEWHHTLPPVVIGEWADSAAAGESYTTVGDWRGYSPIEWDGVWYGQKSEEFLRVLPLPRRVPCALELCLAIHPNEPDLPALTENGWRLSDPRERTATPDAYRHFVRSSRGEFSVAKNGYVRGRTGWVSDRTVCYLAAGRPAVVQNTGLGEHVPVGEGLLVFDDLDGAAAALTEVESDYARHAAAARRLAAEHFASERVLPRLLEIAGV